MRTIKNYLMAWTEDFREWFAWRIFPEQAFYMEAVRRLAQIDENSRCVEMLEEADSACSGWAAETIKIKLTSLDDILKKLDEYGEPPF